MKYSRPYNKWTSSIADHLPWWCLAHSKIYRDCMKCKTSLGLHHGIRHAGGCPSPINQLCMLHIPLYLRKIYKFSLFSFFFGFFASPTLTVMHLRIMLYTTGLL